MEEYRVYSQLIRHGYRIQRFVYNSEKNAKSDENSSKKRKVIVEPENGLWMTDIQEQNKDYINIHNSKKSVNDIKEIDTNINNFSIKIYQDTTEDKNILNSVYEVIENLLCSVENIETQSTNFEYQNNTKKEKKLDTNLNINEDKRKKKSKVEIISDETLLSNIRIVTNQMNDYIKKNNVSTNWRASRIQRNVKLVPRRTNKLSTTDILDPNIKNSECCSKKHKFKKSKHEV